MKPQHALAILPVALGVGNQIAQSSFFPNNASHAASAPGKWRWDVKTLGDADASTIDYGHVQPLTVADAATYVSPDEHLLTDTPRGAGTQEKTVYQVSGFAVAFKPEQDGDYHLLISDNAADTGPELGVEIPTPDYAASGSTSGPLFSAARSTFESSISHGVSDAARYTRVVPAIPVTVTGVGFWDEQHGQRGLHSGFELHPVIKLDVLTGKVINSNPPAPKSVGGVKRKTGM